MEVKFKKIQVDEFKIELIDSPNCKCGTIGKIYKNGSLIVENRSDTPYLDLWREDIAELKFCPQCGDEIILKEEKDI